jgi:hypothetical protein
MKKDDHVIVVSPYEPGKYTGRCLAAPRDGKCRIRLAHSGEVVSVKVVNSIPDGPLEEAVCYPASLEVKNVT